MSSPRSLSLLLLVLLIAGGSAAISFAWGYQLIGGYAPCELCLQQRVPYYAGLPLALLALFFLWRGGPRVLLALALLLVAALFAYGAGLGVYQAGAEWGFWTGPTDCGGGSAPPANAADLLNALRSTQLVSCTEASWRLFGLSFAGWNAVVSAGLVLLALAVLWTSRANGPKLRAD